MVLPHEYTITRSDSARPILGSFGASACFILALYNEEYAILAHTDYLTDIDSLSILLKSVSKKDTLAHLVSSHKAPRDMCGDIIELLENNNIQIANSYILNQSESVSLAIDARTGAIYSPVSADQLRQTPDIEERLEIALLKSNFGLSGLNYYDDSKDTATSSNNNSFPEFGNNPDIGDCYDVKHVLVINFK